MKTHIKFICLLILVVFLNACGSSSAPLPAPGSAPAPQAPAAAPDYMANEAYAESDDAYDTEITEDELPQGVVTERMIIRNASLRIEANESAADVYNAIIGKTERLGGYEAGCDIGKYDDYTVIHSEIRIPAGRYSELITFINETSNVLSNNMSSEDITEAYTDVQIRLNTKKAALEKYYALLEKVSSVEEIVKVQRTIDDLTVEIESMEGRLRFWSSQASMSTVSLYIRQDNDPIALKKEVTLSALSADDMGYLIKSGLTRTLDVIVVLAQWLLIAAITLSPPLLIIAVLWLVFRKIIMRLIKREKKAKVKKTSKKKAAEDAAEETDKTDE